MVCHSAHPKLIETDFQEREVMSKREDGQGTDKKKKN